MTVHHPKAFSPGFTNLFCFGHLRYLLLKDLPIVWQQWVDCILWDRSSNSRLIHHRASTDSHLYPTTPEKMRNQLAEDMMGAEMLNVMLCYQVNLGMFQ